MTDPRSSPSAASPEATRATAAAAFAQLVRWGAGVRYAEIPDDVRERALLVLADDLAAMIAVRRDPQVTAVQRDLVPDHQPPEATVFGSGRRRGERASVAAANGTAADWAELDEGYRPATCHAGLYVLPALLAEIEFADRTGEELVTALVAGYEVVARCARAWRHAQMTIHPHALLAPIGAAAGAAYGSALSADHAVAAVAGGASTAMLGSFEHALTGDLARNVWTGIAAWTGVRMARWAPLGIGGSPAAPHTAFATAMGATPQLDQLTDGLGEQWAIRDGYHKRFACCQYGHSTIEALLELRTELGDGGLDAITAITVQTHPLALKLDNARPATSLAAKFSVPHVAAAALVLGDVDADGCAPDALVDPRIVALRERVTLEPYRGDLTPPHDRPSHVIVTLADGRTLERTCLSAIGSPDRPLSLDDLLDHKIARSVAAEHPDFVPTIRRLLEQPTLLQRPWGQLLDQLLKD